MCRISQSIQTADRWAKNGYRKVYPASKVPADQRVDNELWYYWDNDEQKFEKVDPREVARLRLEYVGLAAKDQNPYDTTVYPNKDDSLTLPKLQLYGINRWQDIRKNTRLRLTAILTRLMSPRSGITMHPGPTTTQPLVLTRLQHQMRQRQPMNLIRSSKRTTKI